MSLPPIHSQHSLFQPPQPCHSKLQAREVRPILAATRDAAITNTHVLRDKYINKGLLYFEWVRKIPTERFRHPKAIRPPSLPSQKPTPRVKREISVGFRQLGSGGYGTVFPLNRNDALKVNLKDEFEIAKKERANYELWKGVPHIINLKASYCDETKKVVGLVMPRLSSTLSKRIQSWSGTLYLKETVSLLRQFLETYAASSAKGLIYGDYKLDNISFINNRLTIFDLGLAHTLKDKKTKIFGVLAYTPPERCLDPPSYDCSSDLWNMGCIGYEAFVGNHLFSVENHTPPYDYLQKIIDQLGPLPPNLQNKKFFGEPKPFTAPANLGAWKDEIRKICAYQWVPKEATDLFIELLSGMLCYENRIFPPRGMYICDQITYYLDPYNMVPHSKLSSSSSPRIASPRSAFASSEPHQANLEAQKLRPLMATTRDAAITRTHVRRGLLDLKWARPKRTPTERFIRPKVTRHPSLRWQMPAPCKRDLFPIRLPSLGAGTYGTAYEIASPVHRDHVLKVNHGSFEAAKREERNYALWKDIPHTMKLITSFEDGKVLGLVMKKFSHTLENRLKKTGPLPFRDVVSLARQLLETYTVSSKRGLIYGDYKPNNVSFEEDSLTIFDFGLAHSEKEGLKGMFCALAYAAPELCFKNLKHDCSGDLWAIGCCIYEAITAKMLFNVPNDLPHSGYIQKVIDKIGPPPYKPNFEVKPPAELGVWRQKIIDQCATQKIPQKGTDLLIELLSGMLCYENRIDPEKGLALCDQIIQALDNSGH